MMLNSVIGNETQCSEESINVIDAYAPQRSAQHDNSISFVVKTIVYPVDLSFQHVVRNLFFNHHIIKSSNTFVIPN